MKTSLANAFALVRLQLVLSKFHSWARSSSWLSTWWTMERFGTGYEQLCTLEVAKL